MLKPLHTGLQMVEKLSFNMGLTNLRQFYPKTPFSIASMKLQSLQMRRFSNYPKHPKPTTVETRKPNIEPVKLKPAPEPPQKATLNLYAESMTPRQQLQRELQKQPKAVKETPKSSSNCEPYASEDLDNIIDKNVKIVRIKVTTLRLDAFLKTSLGLSRNRIETLFYENKIRVNGEKVMKKSISISEGNEIDVIKGPSITNPDYMIVSRIEVIGIRAEDEESIDVKIRRFKSLLIENYAAK